MAKKSGWSLSGKSNKSADQKLTAKKPGWRRAKDGSKYFERRANRADNSKKNRL